MKVREYVYTQTKTDKTRIWKPNKLAIPKGQTFWRLTDFLSFPFGKRDTKQADSRLLQIN